MSGLPNLKEPKILREVKSGMVFAGDDDSGEITILKEDLDEILQWVDERIKRLRLRREAARKETDFLVLGSKEYWIACGRLVELDEQLGEKE